MTISHNSNRSAGYVLLSVMLLIAIMLIMLAVEAPRIAQQIKRGKEEELVHRGMEYARAIKKYRRKMGAMPTSIEQLENTNHIRFLRKRYKDPITGKDEWKLVHVGEAEIPMPKANNPGLQGSGDPGIKGGTFSNSAGTAPAGIAAVNTGNTGFGGGTALGAGTSGLSNGSGLSGVSGTQTAGTQPGNGSLGSLATSTSGNGGLQVGGGAIIGVASTSKKTGIKEFNDR
ncbi:MAG TPA: hypothetical protein VFY05_12350, partial [Candidatus Angelobacter sp.]|nr:hypothetical protein [Candidatus Angelobacter sp.]